MDIQKRNKLITLAALAAGTILLLILVPVLWRVFTVGTLSVNGGTGQISIEVTNKKGAQIYKTTAANPVVRLTRGTYTVTARGKNLETVKKVDIHARRTTTINLNSVKLLDYEPVTADFASSVIADDNYLSYLDMASGQLVRIDSQNTYSTLKDVMFKQATWLTTNTAIGRTADNTYYFVDYAAKSFKPLAGFDSEDISYGVGSGTAYVFKQGKMYELNTATGDLNKLFNAPITTPRVIPGTEYIATKSYKTKGTDAPVVTTYISVFDKKGAVKGSIELPTTEGIEDRYGLAWSPDGQHLVITDSEGTGTVYDPAMKAVTTLPTKSSSRPVWADATTFLYSSDGNIWRYSLANHAVTQLATVSGTKRIQDMTLDKSKKQLYATLSVKTNQSEIVRIRLDGTRPDDKAFTLSAMLPLTLSDNCYVNYMNFAKPSLLYTVLHNDDKNSCAQAAATELGSYGIDTANENIQIITVN